MNEVVINNKPIDINSIEIDNIDTRDYPDFCDAYATYALFEDGSELSENQLDELADRGIVNELIWDKTLWV